MLMDRVVKVIGNLAPELELQLDSLIFSGIPRAVFSVLHRKDCPKALELIEKNYNLQLRGSDTLEMKEYMAKWERRANV
jgi:hypothetical protein